MTLVGCGHASLARGSAYGGELVLEGSPVVAMESDGWVRIAEHCGGPARLVDRAEEAGLRSNQDPRNGERVFFVCRDPERGMAAVGGDANPES